MHEFNNQKPLYLQLKELIEKLILKEVLKPEEAIPSIRTLAKDFQLNPLTVTNAIYELVGDGILHVKRGIGTFVCENAKFMIQSQQLDNFKKNELFSTIEKGKSLGITEKEMKEIIKNIYGGKDEF